MLTSYSSISAAHRTLTCNTYLVNFLSKLTAKNSTISLKNMSGITQPKEFTLDSYDVIGFDLDYTICKYKISNVSQLVYRNVTKYLIEKKKYSPDIFEDYSQSCDFYQKGIILDSPLGNFLKLDSECNILQAHHGTKRLSLEETLKVYGKTKNFLKAKSFFSNKCLTHSHDNGYFVFQDYFSIPVVKISALIIDRLDQENDHRISNYTFASDILESIQDMYKREGFLDGTGGYFSALLQDPDSYIVKNEQATLDWLKNLTKHKKVFLLTNSNADMAKYLLEKCVGADWRDYFHLVVAYAQKPVFFTGQRPFIGVNSNEAGQCIGSYDLCEKEVYSEGNWQDLYHFFRQICQKQSPKVLYFGDSIVDDIYAPATYTSCHTVAILEEMASEGMEGYPSHHDSKEELNSSNWGSFFSNVHVPDKSNCLTWLVSHVVKHSQIAIPDLKAISDLPLDHKFSCFEHLDNSLAGFYPSTPIGLK